MRNAQVILFVLFLPLAARAATCDAGYWLNENGTCVGCLANHYCVGDDIMRACPEIAYTRDQLKQKVEGLGYTVITIGEVRLWSTWSFNETAMISPELCVLALTDFVTNEGTMFGVFFLYSSETNDYTTLRSKYWKEANPGYYLSQNLSNRTIWYNIKPCTNARPSDSHYSGPGTPDSADGIIVDANDCSWECDAGYGRHGDECLPLCAADITKLNTSNGLSYNIYRDKITTPTLNILRNNTVCYVNLESGTATGAINIQHGNTFYHVTN